MKNRQFYTSDEVAEFLRVTVLTVYAYIKSGKLRAVRLGRTYRIAQEDFDRLIKENKT